MNRRSRTNLPRARSLASSTMPGTSQLFHRSMAASYGGFSVAPRAVFRVGSDSAVFRADGTVARQQIVKIGRQNGLEAEILNGLADGDLVVLHPSDQIQNGVRIRQR